MKSLPISKPSPKEIRKLRDYIAQSLDTDSITEVIIALARWGDDFGWMNYEATAAMVLCAIHQISTDNFSREALAKCICYCFFSPNNIIDCSELINPPSSLIFISLVMQRENMNNLQTLLFLQRLSMNTLHSALECLIDHIYGEIYMDDEGC